MRSSDKTPHVLPPAIAILPPRLRASVRARRAVLPVIGFSVAAALFSLAAMVLHAYGIC